MVADLVHNQVGRGWRVVVACPADGRLASDVAQLGGEVRLWAARRSPGPAVPSECRALAAIVAGTAPDVVHLHSSKAGLVGRLVLRGRLPTVFQPHAWSFLAVHGPVRVATLGWERAAARWCSALAVVSERERQVGLERGVRGEYVLLPNGVDLRRYRPAAAEERAELRAALALPDGPLVVCAGRLSRQKGQDVLLRAWPAVRRAVPGAWLVLVGDGPDREALAALSGPGVRFVGSVDDTAPWLRAADVVALPSRWEGMPLAVLEALAAGRSVVASDVAGVAEALAEGGGTVVPVDDPVALARCLSARLVDPALAMAEGASGRATAKRRFDVDVTSAAAHDLYVRLLGGR